MPASTLRPRIIAAASHAAIPAAVEALRAGELVAMPTETVYGLAADATSARAVAGIFAAKGRPEFNPLIIHAASVAGVRDVATLTPQAERLVEAFWPGPLTLVLPRRPEGRIADLAVAGLSSVAVRVPAHPVARALLAAFGGPLAAPSANRSGHVTATTAAHVASDIGEAVAIIIDDGPAPIGLESTIVGFDGDRPTLLRAGGVNRIAIEAVLGERLAVVAVDPGAPKAPGMLASHYAPAAALRLDAAAVQPGEALLAFGQLPPGVTNAMAIVNLSPTRDLTEAAANLFSALRSLDGKADVIAVSPIPDNGLGEAINDRLRRAAAPR